MMTFFIVKKGKSNKECLCNQVFNDNHRLLMLRLKSFGILWLLTFSLLQEVVNPNHADAGELKQFLQGKRAFLTAIDDSAGGKIYIIDLQSMQLQELSDEINCRSPVFSPDGSRILYRQNNSIYIRLLSGGNRIKVAEGYGNRWWVDEKGDEWVYYATKFERTTWPDLGFGIKTYRIRLKDKKVEKVVDWKTSTGPSPDGTHLAADHYSVIIFDEQNRGHLINQGMQGCFASLSPDNKYQLLHLGIQHDRMMIHDKSDRLIWQMDLPVGTDYFNGTRWSNQSDYALVGAREKNGNQSILIVKLSDIDGQTKKAKPNKTGYVRVLDARTGSQSWGNADLWFALDSNKPFQTFPNQDKEFEIAEPDGGGCSFVRSKISKMSFMELIFAMFALFVFHFNWKKRSYPTLNNKFWKRRRVDGGT